MPEEAIVFDYSELRGRIKTRYGSQEACAQDIGLTASMLSRSLNGRREFTSGEIIALCAPERLSIKPEEIGFYFFTPKVR